VIIDFFKLYADKCHHGKEETLFFPAMENAGIKRETSIIGHLIIEHETSRKYLSQMHEAIASKLINPPFLISSAHDYIDLIRKHIVKENNDLFPMGDAKIPMKIQQELLVKFEKFEETVMGKDIHMKLHDILNRLEDKYFPVEVK